MAGPHASGFAAEFSAGDGAGGEDGATGADGAGLVVAGLAFFVGLVGEQLGVEQGREADAGAAAAEVGAEQETSADVLGGGHSTSTLARRPRNIRSPRQ